VRYILTFSIALEIFAHHQQRIHFSSEKGVFFLSAMSFWQNPKVERAWCMLFISTGTGDFPRK
jgi:hypothetical protein